MSMPKAYEPQIGYKYQILCKNPQYSNTWEHCDYAKDTEEKRYLMKEYYIAYGPGFVLKSILLPKKYWH